MHTCVYESVSVCVCVFVRACVSVRVCSRLIVAHHDYHHALLTILLLCITSHPYTITVYHQSPVFTSPQFMRPMYGVRMRIRNSLFGSIWVELATVEVLPRPSSIAGGEVFTGLTLARDVV